MAISKITDGVTVFVLMYGDRFDLHRRCLDSVFANVKRPDVNLEVRIGMNAVSPSTSRYVRECRINHYIDFDLIVEHSKNNLKYPVMREMIYKKPISTDWVVWLDDDSYIEDPRWLTALQEKIDEEYDTGGRIFGKLYTWDLLEGQADWLKAAHWYKGVPLQTASRHNKTVNRIVFPTGGYWAIPTSTLLDLFWPDQRLEHNGGDTALGEAIRQQGYRAVNAHKYVKINQDKRRGFSQLPAGAKTKRRAYVD